MGATLLIAYASGGLSQLASQLYFFLVFRFLSVEDVGIYSWAIAVATIFTYVMDLGLVTFLVGELSHAAYRVRQVILLVTIVRAPIILLGWLLLEIWARLAAPSYVEYSVVAIITLSYIVQLFELGIIPWLQVRERQGAVNIVGLIMPAGRLVGIVLLLWLRRDVTVWQVAALALVTQVVSTLCFGLLILSDARRSPAGACSSHTVSQLLRRFWLRGRKLTVMYGLMALQSRLDWLLVSSLLSKVALANYSLANKVLELAMLMGGIGARTAFPWLSRADADTPHLRDRLGLLRRVFVLSSALLSTALFLWSPILADLFFGDKYLGAEEAMRLMTLASAVFMLNQYMFYSLLAQKLEKEYTRVLIFAAILQTAVDLVLIPRMGITGAALGMLVMGIILHIGQAGLLLRSGTLERSETIGLEVFLLGAICITAALWLGSASIFFNTLAAWIAVAMLSSFLVFRRDDRVQIRVWTYQMLAVVMRCATKSSRPGASN